jgi:hypothetical protein
VNRRTFLFSAPLLWACRGKPGEGFRGAAWVASEDEPSLASVDLLAFSVRRRVAISGRANRLVMRPGSRILYCCDFRSGWIEEIDTEAGRRTRGVRLEGPILAIRAQSDGKQLWVAAGDPPRLVPVDTGSLRTARPVMLPADAVQMDISGVGARAALTMSSGETAFVDLAEGRISGIVRLDSALGGVRFRSDGRAAIVADLGRRMVCVLDPAQARLAVELPLALRPDRMWMKQDGGQVFVSGEGRDAIAIVYPYRTEVAQTFLSGRKPGEMADSASPAYLFVSNPEANSLTIFDIDTQKVVAVTQVGLSPGPIAVTPDQSYALVLNRGSGDMAVIRTAAIAPGREKRVPLFTMIPVATNPSHAVVLPA